MKVSFKRIRNQLCFNFSLLLCPLSIDAETAVNESHNDVLLAKVSACFTSGKFHQTKKLEAIEKPIQSEGMFIFSCEHGLIWHTQSPILETIIYSKTGDHFRITEDKTAERLKGRIHSRLSSLLINLIGNDKKYISKLFETETTKNSLELTPKKRQLKKFIQSISLEERKREVDVTLHHSAEQQTNIHVYDKTEFTSLDISNCKSELINSSTACRYLFQ